MQYACVSYPNFRICSAFSNLHTLLSLFPCFTYYIKPSSIPLASPASYTIFFLSFTTRFLDCAVFSHCLDFKSSKIFLEPLYYGFHCVKATLIKVFNDIFLSKCRSIFSVVILLDLYVAFNTLSSSSTHSSWASSVLAWYLSYLWDHSFKVCFAFLTSVSHHVS